MTTRLPAWATAARLVFWSSWVPLFIPPVLEFYIGVDAGSRAWVTARVVGASVGALAGVTWGVAEYQRRKPLRRSDFFPPIARDEINGCVWEAVFIVFAVRAIVTEWNGGDIPWLILAGGSVPYFTVSVIRALWYRRQYAIADQENRTHGR